MAARILTVVCAWCHRVVTQGPSTSPVTHTICPGCIEWTMECQSNPDAFFRRVSDFSQQSPRQGYFGDVN